MRDLGAAAALALAVVFAWAAVAKVRDRAATVGAFRGLRLPRAVVLATLVPIVELGLAVGLVVVPAAAALVALALLLAFSIVIGRAVAGRWGVACACFGGGPDARPVSVVALVRNGGLGALAVIASGAGPGRLPWPSVRAVAVVAAAGVIGRVALDVAEARREGRVGSAAPLGEGTAPR